MDSEPSAASKNPSTPDATEWLAGPDPGILGIDNVRLDLPVAGIGSRSLAIVVDSIAIMFLAAVWMVIAMGFAALLWSLDVGTTAAWVILAIGLFLLDSTYYIVCEIRMGGRTLGKSMVGLRTVNRFGGQASVGAIVVRNALRIFDYLIGVLMILLDRRHRRLGDLVGGTLVIHDAAALEGEETHLGRLPAFFTVREIALVENLVRRIPSLLPDRAREIASQLLEQVERRDPGFVSAAAGEAQADPVFELWRIFEVRVVSAEQS